MRRPLLAALASALLLAPCAALSVPDLTRARRIGPYRIYPDHEKRTRFYYAPGDLELATEEGGRPALHFLVARYTGSAATGDQGRIESGGTLTLRLRMKDVPPQELVIAHNALARLAGRSRVELRPLPVTRFESVLVYAPIGGDGRESQRAVAGSGEFEAEEGEAAETDTQGFWTERSYTVSMDAHTAELFWTLLQRGEVALSVTYAFYTKGWVGGAQVKLQHAESSEERVQREGVPDTPPEEDEAADAGDSADAEEAADWEQEQEDRVEALADELREHLERTLATDAEQRLVRAGAVGIRVDARRWPELFQQLDFNEQVPPGYAALRIYCYDFANALRPDLLFKKVEVEAASVGGRSIPVEAKFLFSQPEVYRRSVRFPFAVRLDRPYRYRVTTAARDGTQDVGEWRERAEWAPLLDVTTGADSEASQDGGTDR